VPVISRFFGIIVRMFYQDHDPAHFHAEYQGEKAKFSFSGELLVGRITSGTARRLIKEWAALHQEELQANWERMKAGETMEQIPPLE
jgi:hypothetical protein